MAPFDTSRGTSIFILGGGGTSAPLRRLRTEYPSGMPQAKVTTKETDRFPMGAGVFGEAQPRMR